LEFGRILPRCGRTGLSALLRFDRQSRSKRIPLLSLALANAARLRWPGDTLSRGNIEPPLARVLFSLEAVPKLQFLEQLHFFSCFFKAKQHPNPLLVA
jgi:hypothetical protein